MINVIDLLVGAFVLVYLVKNAGGVAKTLKTLVIIALSLMVFGIAAQFILNLSLAEPIQKALDDSYAIKVSHVLIRWFYPAVEKTVPKLDSFIKDKIISAPAPQVTTPKIAIPEKSLPKLSLPEELPQLK